MTPHDLLNTLDPVGLLALTGTVMMFVGVVLATIWSRHANQPARSPHDHEHSPQGAAPAPSPVTPERPTDGSVRASGHAAPAHRPRGRGAARAEVAVDRPRDAAVLRVRAVALLLRRQEDADTVAQGAGHVTGAGVGGDRVAGAADHQNGGRAVGVHLERGALAVERPVVAEVDAAGPGRAEDG